MHLRCNQSDAAIAPGSTFGFTPCVTSYTTSGELRLEANLESARTDLLADRERRAALERRPEAESECVLVLDLAGDESVGLGTREAPAVGVAPNLLLRKERLEQFD